MSPAKTAAAPSFDAFAITDEPFRPEAEEASRIPAALAAFIASKGHEAKLVAARTDHMTKYRLRGFAPLLANYLPEEIRLALRGIYEPPERNNDELRIGDGIVVYRSIKARDYWDGVERNRASEVLQTTSLADQQAVVDEINSQARQMGGLRALELQADELASRPAADHVIGGASAEQAFGPELRDELLRRREEIPG